MAKENESKTSAAIVLIILITWSLALYFMGSEGGVHPFGFKNFFKRSLNVFSLKAITDPTNPDFKIEPNNNFRYCKISIADSTPPLPKKEEKESLVSKANETHEINESAQEALNGSG